MRSLTPVDQAVIQVILSLGRGGLEAMAVNLAIDLKQSGLRSGVIALDEGGLLESRLHEAGVEYHVLNGRQFRNPAFHLSLASKLRAMRAGVIHTHGFAPLLHTVPAVRLAGVSRVVHTEHSYEYLIPRPSLRYALKLLSRTTRVFALVGDRMRPYYESIVGVASHRLEIIPNGIDLDRYRPKTDQLDLRLQLGLPPHGFIVGSAGRLAAEKNYGLLLQAIARNRHAGIDMHVVLFGEGEERAALGELAECLGIQSAVTFAGWR